MPHELPVPPVALTDACASKVTGRLQGEEAD